MTNIIYDAQTGETSIIEVPDEEMSIIEHSQPTLEERLTALETLELERMFDV